MIIPFSSLQKSDFDSGELDLSGFESFEKPLPAHLQDLKIKLAKVRFLLKVYNDPKITNSYDKGGNHLNGGGTSFNKLVSELNSAVFYVSRLGVKTLTEQPNRTKELSDTCDRVISILESFYRDYNLFINPSAVYEIERYASTVFEDYILAQTQAAINEKIQSELSVELRESIAQFRRVKADSDFSGEFSHQLDEKSVGSVASLRKLNAMWRTIWFWFTFGFSIIYAIGLLAFISMPADQASIGAVYLSDISPVDSLALKLILALPIAISLLRYQHYSRLVKVYSNLEEQYRHRSLVARTIQGLLKSIETQSVEFDAALLQQLRQEAAKAIFTQKPIGHLGGREGGGILSDSLRDK